MKSMGWLNACYRLLYLIQQKTGITEKKTGFRYLSDMNFFSESTIKESDVIRNWEFVREKYIQSVLIKDFDFKFDNDNLTKYLTEPTNHYANHLYQYFSNQYLKVDSPIVFNKDYYHNIVWPSGTHWRHYAKSGLPYNDIKLVWEPSRLIILFLLVRRYHYDNNVQWLEKGCDLILEWVNQNPPELTVNWACGQENAFRLFAMLFFLLNIPNLMTESEKYHKLVTQVTLYAWRVGVHINNNIIYARSQQNNHAISESIALWIIGLLFPIFKMSEHWIKKGKNILSKELNQQVYDDGSYIQHSMNYHRLVLDDLLFLTSTLKLFNKSVPAEVRNKFEKMTSFLYEFVDPVSGKVPNYGYNDGANILLLSCTDYTDFRPVLQASWYALFNERFYNRGPWDEKMLWLFGQEALKSPLVERQVKKSIAFRDGGYYILRDKNSWCMTRCHSYRNRPGQADMLHIDLWHNGVNIVVDSGSYRYYTEDSSSNYFKSTIAHSTVTINDKNQMEQGPGFLWFNWTRSNLIYFDDSKFEGEHYSYIHDFKSVHRRIITNLKSDCWEVADTVFTRNTLRDLSIKSRFHLINDTWMRKEDKQFVIFQSNKYNYSIAIVNIGEIDISIYKSEQSIYYARKEEIPVLEIFHIGNTYEKEFLFKTYFGPSDILLNKIGIN
ncbi:alginate lyase family protein [candidate division KSB1 bacterium]|nr:alginate lyase family protein [candidate division KSB1 bacterium]